MALEGLPRRGTPEKTNVSVVAAGLDDTRELCEGSDGGVVHPEGRVHAACEAGMAGILNDLLVRSGGRAADGKDKVRGQRKQEALSEKDSHVVIEYHRLMPFRDRNLAEPILEFFVHAGGAHTACMMYGLRLITKCVMFFLAVSQGVKTKGQTPSLAIVILLASSPALDACRTMPTRKRKLTIYCADTDSDKINLD